MTVCFVISRGISLERSMVCTACWETDPPPADVLSSTISMSWLVPPRFRQIFKMRLDFLTGSLGMAVNVYGMSAISVCFLLRLLCRAGRAAVISFRGLIPPGVIHLQNAFQV